MNQFSKIYESDPEKSFLENLYQFYSNKFSDEELQNKLVDVCLDLLRSSEISEAAMLSFFKEKGIKFDPKRLKPPKPPKRSTDYRRGESYC